MNSLWTSLRRHIIFRVTITYLMMGWIIMQITEVMGPALKFPDWVMSAVLFLLVCGLPIVLLVIWGLQSKHRAMAGSTALVQKERSTSKLDLALYGAVAVVVAASLSQWLLPGDALTKALVPVLATKVDTKASEMNVLPEDDPGEIHNSVAVIPFLDISQNKDKGYFSDGLTEEVITALSDINGLSVASRTTSFSLRDTNEDLRQLGRTLKVTHVLEGSVRNIDDQVRITAQLVAAESGFQLWSKTYDRPLDDVFAVQEEVAHLIANELEFTAFESAAPGAAVASDLRKH